MESHSTATTIFRCSDDGLIENLVSGTHPILYLERLLFWWKELYQTEGEPLEREEEQKASTVAPLCLGTVFFCFCFFFLQLHLRIVTTWHITSVTTRVRL